MKFNRILLVSICLCFAILSGCVNQIGIPKRISSDRMDAVNPAMDIESNGRKHIAWVEERIPGIGLETIYVIVYLRTNFGETGLQYEFTPPTNFDYSRPDIAVTEDGTVYLVWMKINKTDPVNAYGCYDIIPPSGPFTPTCHELSDYAAESYKIVDPPKVAANGNEVYAVYNVPFGSDFDGVRLRYRKLGSIFDDYTGWVSLPSIYKDHTYQIAVDSNGKAHVTWLQYYNAINAVYYNSNVTVDGFESMNSQRQLTDYGNYNDITITGYPTEEVFISYISYSPEEMYVAHCATSSCVTPISSFKVPLDPAIAPWSSWFLDSGAVNDTLYLTFLGHNDLTTGIDYEVYYYRYPDASPTRLTTNDYDDFSPMITSSDGIPVIAWASDIGDRYERTIWDSFNGARKLTESYVQFPRDGELVSNGEWVAGVWTDYHSEGDTTFGIWLAFNAYNVNIPLILK